MKIAKSQIYSVNTYTALLEHQQKDLKLMHVNEYTAFIPILKNAFNWARHTFRPLDPSITPQQYLAFVRDPIDRWVTATATYCRKLGLLKKHYVQYINQNCFDSTALTQSLDRLLKHTLILDAHSVPQTVYLLPYADKDITLLLVNNELSERVNRLYGPLPSVPPINATQGNPYAEFLTLHLKQFLDRRHDITAQLRQLYIEDYKLLKNYKEL